MQTACLDFWYNLLKYIFSMYNQAGKLRWIKIYCLMVISDLNSQLNKVIYTVENLCCDTSDAAETVLDGLHRDHPGNDCMKEDTHSYA